MPKILVIDDCSLTVFVLHRALAAAGYEVRATCSSRAGIEILQREPVDLVITDVNMPPPDGIELLQFAEREKLKMPFIVMSGEEWPQNRFPVARLLGAVFTLHKPIATERLFEVVEAALDAQRGTVIVKKENESA